MKFNTLIYAAAIGQATATLDILTGRPLSETIFGLTQEQVKNVDNHLARVEASASNTILEAFNTATKTFNKIVTDINKNSGTAVNDAATSVDKALTPEIRQKVKKAITSVVDATLNSLL